MDKKVITLVKSQAYIDGAWIGEPAMPVTDKATGEVIGKRARHGSGRDDAGDRGCQTRHCRDGRSARPRSAPDHPAPLVSI